MSDFSLDQIYSRDHFDALASAPDTVADQLRAALPPGGTLHELETRDAVLVGALGQIDALATRAMKARLDHALAGEPSIGAPTRNVFAATVVNYASTLSVLAERTRELAARGGAAAPDHVADLVVGAARSVLGLRAALRERVLRVISETCTLAVAHADGRARDRGLPEGERKAWSAMRRDLEGIAAHPAAIASAPMATRVAALPEQLDEPDAVPDATFADMIELD